MNSSTSIRVSSWRMQLIIRIDERYIINIILSMVKSFYYMVLVCQIVNTICCIALAVFVWLIWWSVGSRINIKAGRFNSISKKTRSWYCFNTDINFLCSWHVLLTRRTTPQMWTQTAFGSKLLETAYVEAMKEMVRQSLRDDERAPLPHWIQQKVFGCGNKILSDNNLLVCSSWINHHTIDIWYTVDYLTNKSAIIKNGALKNPQAWE